MLSCVKLWTYTYSSWMRWINDDSDLTYRSDRHGRLEVYEINPRKVVYISTDGRRWYETPDFRMSAFSPFQEYRVRDSE